MLRENVLLKQTISNMFEKKKFDNLIIMGGECMGKTTLLRHIVHNHIKDDYKFLFIHYLDDKGIDMIRNRIKHFTSLKTKKHKFILIDDADNLSTSAQQSLRRIMEEKYKTCSFIFTLQNFKNLIFPIHSRCLLFELQQLHPDTSRFYNKNIDLNGKTKKEIYELLMSNESLLHDCCRIIMDKYRENNCLQYLKEYSKPYSAFKITNMLYNEKLILQ